MEQHAGQRNRRLIKSIKSYRLNQKNGGREKPDAARRSLFQDILAAWDR